MADWDYRALLVMMMGRAPSESTPPCDGEEAGFHKAVQRSRDDRRLSNSTRGVLGVPRLSHLKLFKI